MLEFIRDTLLRLKPTGANGFEGLVAEIIFGITKIPSRLANGGTQFGIDGSAVFPEDGICFEAKLYSGKLPRNEIISKVATLGMHKDEADLLWVLGATTPVGTQATDIYEIAAKDGISILILDWQEQPLPLLAISLAMAKERVVPWLVGTLKDEGIRKPLSSVLEQLMEDGNYASQSEKLHNQFNAVDLATANAKQANQKWLKGVFSRKNSARSKLGQPIVPLDDSVMTLPRSDITEQINQDLNDQKQTVFLLGEEGGGKSWIAASLMNKFDGLAIFISAERLESHKSEEQVRDLVIRTLAAQCGQDSSDKNVQTRWGKRLKAWVRSEEGNRLLVVLDGLNQRPTLPWDEIILWLNEAIFPSVGKLVVTTRPHLFDSKIKAGLVDGSYLTFSISNWKTSERDELLNANGVNPALLDRVTAQSLINPRLLGIALEVLPRDDMEAWQGLTTTRLLFEHLHLSQRYNIEPEPIGVLAERLSQHAQKALEKLATHSPETALVFQADNDSVAEGRFFEKVAGPKRYQLKEEGLTLALGYALVDRVWAEYDFGDLDETFSKILEPIETLDRTAEVVIAALTVCAWDSDRFSKDVFIVILYGFINLQNPDTKYYISFRDICFERFDAFLHVLEDSFLANDNPLNKDWLESVAHDAKSDKKKWEQLAGTIERWFSYYSKDPENELRRYPNGLTNQKEIEKRTVRAKETLNSMSSFEHELLAEMQDNNGDLGSLTTLGLELLAQKPLAPFTRSFLRWGISIYLDNCWPALHSGFQRLANFNQIDWHEMRTAFSPHFSP